MPYFEVGKYYFFKRPFVVSFYGMELKKAKLFSKAEINKSLLYMPCSCYWELWKCQSHQFWQLLSFYPVKYSVFWGHGEESAWNGHVVGTATSEPETSGSPKKYKTESCEWFGFYKY